jgi:hypothetical protein
LSTPGNFGTSNTDDLICNFPQYGARSGWFQFRLTSGMGEEREIRITSESLVFFENLIGGIRPGTLTLLEWNNKLVW